MAAGRMSTLVSFVMPAVSAVDYSTPFDIVFVLGYKKAVQLARGYERTIL